MNNMLNKLRNWFKKPKSSDTITVTVTTEDYRNANCYTDNRYCPLAMCLKRHNYKNLHVRGYYVLIKNIDYRISNDWTDKNPNDINDDIFKAKSGHTIEPTTVTLTRQ